MKDLERQAIPYELKNDGAIVMVPRDRMTRVRMKLAEGGLPKGGGIGYEIFDKSDTLGATSFVQNINHLRALEGELARTIKAIDRVQAARVHLVLPGAPAVLARQDRALGLDRAARARRARGAAGARDPPSGRLGGEWPEAAARFDRRRGRPAARRRRGERRHRRDRRLGGRAPGRLRAAPEGPDRIDRLLGGRAGPRPRAALGRIRLQPHHRDVRQVRSRRPRAALEPDARGVERERQPGRPGHGRQRTARRAAEPAGPARTTRPAGPGAARPEQEVGRNRQLRDLPLDQDAGHRRRAREAHLGRRAGRRQLHQERKGRHRLPAAHQGGARPHRRAGAQRDRLRPEARRPDRGREPALRRGAGRADPGAERLHARSCS